MTYTGHNKPINKSSKFRYQFEKNHGSDLPDMVAAVREGSSSAKLLEVGAVNSSVKFTVQILKYPAQFGGNFFHFLDVSEPSATSIISLPKFVALMSRSTFVAAVFKMLIVNWST